MFLSVIGMLISIEAIKGSAKEGSLMSYTGKRKRTFQVKNPLEGLKYLLCSASLSERLCVFVSVTDTPECEHLKRDMEQSGRCD